MDRRANSPAHPRSARSESLSMSCRNLNLFQILRMMLRYFKVCKALLYTIWILSISPISFKYNAPPPWDEDGQDGEKQTLGLRKCKEAVKAANLFPADRMRMQQQPHRRATPWRLGPSLCVTCQHRAVIPPQLLPWAQKVPSKSETKKHSYIPYFITRKAWKILI